MKKATKIHTNILLIMLILSLSALSIQRIIIDPILEKKNILVDEYKQLKSDLHDCKELLEVHGITVTMYQPYSKQTDNDPHILADGTIIDVWKANELRYVAVSRDLLLKNGGFLKYGDYIFIDNAEIDSGFYQVRDTMNKRFINRVDILRSRGTQRIFKYVNTRIIKFDIPTKS